MEYNTLQAKIKLLEEKCAAKDETIQALKITVDVLNSFASIARKDCGVDKYDVSVCLTHSSGLDITDRYINEDWGTLDRVQKKVLTLVFKEQ